MKQSNFVPVALLLGGLLWAKAHGKPASGVGTMQDSPVSLENIRKGVARGWYSAVLCTLDGKPAVKLSGTANGKPYSDYYPVTQDTWNALKNDGVKSIGACYQERNVGNFGDVSDQSFQNARAAYNEFIQKMEDKYGYDWDLICTPQEEEMFDKLYDDFMFAYNDLQRNRRLHYPWLDYY